MAAVIEQMTLTGTLVVQWSSEFQLVVTMELEERGLSFSFPSTPSRHQYRKTCCRFYSLSLGLLPIPSHSHGVLGSVSWPISMLALGKWECLFRPLGLQPPSPQNLSAPSGPLLEENSFLKETGSYPWMGGDRRSEDSPVTPCFAVTEGSMGHCCHWSHGRWHCCCWGLGLSSIVCWTFPFAVVISWTAFRLSCTTLVLASLVSIWYKLETSERRDP